MCSVNRRSKFIWQRNRTAEQEQRGDGKTCTLASWGLLLWHQHKGCKLYCPCSYCHHLLQAKFPVSGLLVSGSTKGWMFPKGEEVSGIPQASRAGTCPSNVSWAGPEIMARLKWESIHQSCTMVLTKHIWGQQGSEATSTPGFMGSISISKSYSIAQVLRLRVEMKRKWALRDLPPVL